MVQSQKKASPDRAGLFYSGKVLNRTWTRKIIGCKNWTRRTNHFHATTCEVLWQSFFSGAGQFLFLLLLSDNKVSFLMTNGWQKAIRHSFIRLI